MRKLEVSARCDPPDKYLLMMIWESPRLLRWLLPATFKHLHLHHCPTGADKLETWHREAAHANIAALPLTLQTLDLRRAVDCQHELQLRREAVVRRRR